MYSIVMCWMIMTVSVCILCQCVNAVHYEYKDNVERSMSIATNFLRYMGTLQLSDQDVERYKMLMPFFDISARADVLLSELAEHIDEAHHLNAAFNYHKVLTLLEIYSGVGVQREQMWSLLSTGLMQNSLPVGRGLTGMQDAARSTDTLLLNTLFGPTSSIAVNSARVDQNLLLKCSLNDQLHPNVAQRIHQLGVDIHQNNLQWEDQVAIRNVQYNWHIYVVQDQVYMHKHEHTTFTLKQQPNRAGSQPWQRSGEYIVSVTGTKGKHTQYLALDQHHRLIVSTQESVSVRLWRSQEGVFYIDSAQSPCTFLTVDNHTDPWTAKVSAVASYPPSTLAHWDVRATITRIYGN